MHRRRNRHVFIGVQSHESQGHLGSCPGRMKQPSWPYRPNGAKGVRSASSSGPRRNGWTCCWFTADTDSYPKIHHLHKKCPLYLDHVLQSAKTSTGQQNGEHFARVRYVTASHPGYLWKGDRLSSITLWTR